MPQTYLNIVNELLGEMNEVRLTSANFANATNIQLFTKEAVNRAYRDMHDDEYKFPWLAAADSQDEFLGNTYIETVAGTRWYDLKVGQTVDTEYAYVDWNKFTLTTEGVAGASSPYTVRNLKLISLEDWKRYRANGENIDKAENQQYGIPSFVIKHPSRSQFGLSEIPDGVYRIYFYAWNQLTPLSAYDDEVAFPNTYLPTLVARARYHVWQFKDQQNRAQSALQDYKQGLRRIREIVNPSSQHFTDDRTYF